MIKRGAMTNKEKFLKLASSADKALISEVEERIKSRAMLRESQNIALKVLARLDELHWSQRRLAEAMGVSPQQVSKIVSGKENLTIESLVKLEDVLGIPFLAKPMQAQGMPLAHDTPKYTSSLVTYTVQVMEDSVQYGTAQLITKRLMRIPKSKFQRHEQNDYA